MNFGETDETGETDEDVGSLNNFVVDDDGDASSVSPSNDEDDDDEEGSEGGSSPRTLVSSEVMGGPTGGTPLKHTFDRYDGRDVNVISRGLDARLAFLFSCMSLTESFFVPTTIRGDVPATVGTAPPNLTTISDDTAEKNRRATDGLYAAWFRKGEWTLRVPGTDPTKSWNEKQYDAADELRSAIDDFETDWPLVKVYVGNSEYVAHQNDSRSSEGRVLRYPLNARTLDALANGEDVRPVDVTFWERLRGKTNREQDVMRAVMRGERSYTPATRGDLVRLHNASVLSNPLSDFARLMTCVELMRECSDDVKRSLFVSFAGRRVEAGTSSSYL